MKVFISWSGDRSHAVAQILYDWISCTLQSCEPWLSSRDIDRGALWFTEISSQLKDTSVGIICLTHENLNRPWLLFEAGALLKGLSTARVCTLLIDLQPTDLDDPLAQFNHTYPTKNGFYSLAHTLNRQCTAPLKEEVLKRVLDTFWPQFEKDFKAAVEANPIAEKKEKPSEKHLLERILQATNSLSTRMARLEEGNASGGNRAKRTASDLAEDAFNMFLARKNEQDIDKFLLTSSRSVTEYMEASILYKQMVTGHMSTP